MGNTSTCAVHRPTSTPDGRRPGQRQKLGTRIPPSYTVPFIARIPPLKMPGTEWPLSVMKMTNVSRLSPEASSRAINRPTAASRCAIIA